MTMSTFSSTASNRTGSVRSFVSKTFLTCGGIFANDQIDTPTNLFCTGWLNEQAHIVPGFCKGCGCQALQLGNHLGFHIFSYYLDLELDLLVSNPLQEEAKF